MSMPHRAGQRNTLMKRQMSRSVPVVIHLPAKKTKRKQWSDSHMVAAMNGVKHGDIGVNEAATAHGVPKTTLKVRLSGRVLGSI